VKVLDLALEPTKGSSLRCHRRCDIGQNEGCQVDMSFRAIPPLTCENSTCDV